MSLATIDAVWRWLEDQPEGRWLGPNMPHRTHLDGKKRPPAQ